MAITGTHLVIHSAEPEKLRNLLARLMPGPGVDADGSGWMVYPAPPAEIAVHPGQRPRHEITFMCDDLTATMAQLSDVGPSDEGVVFDGDPLTEEWGTYVTMVLPGDVRVLLYEPRHATPG